MSEQWGTHAVELRPNWVTKRFRGKDRQQGEREWRALTLLATYVPGLAPDPWEADLAAAEPTVVMSRLAGTPLRGCSLEDGQIKALATAVTRVHDAVPPDVLAEVPLRPGRQDELIAHIHSWFPNARAQVNHEVGQAMDRGMDWLARSGLDTAGQPLVPTSSGPETATSRTIYGMASEFRSSTLRTRVSVIAPSSSRRSPSTWAAGWNSRWTLTASSATSS